MSIILWRCHQRSSFCAVVSIAFALLNRRYSHAHVDHLHQQNVQSIETSSLHLGLLGDMQHLNSLFCSVAYSVLEQPDEDEGRDEY
ncbi:hypothetical protein ACLB1M_31695 [Escherichia coli]